MRLARHLPPGGAQGRKGTGTKVFQKMCVAGAERGAGVQRSVFGVQMGAAKAAEGMRTASGDVRGGCSHLPRAAALWG